MSIEITDLLTLNADLVAQNRELIKQMLVAANPSLDLRRGVISDTLVKYGGILAARDQANLDRYRQSSSLAAIEADPTLADADIVDNVLSNFLTTRQAATIAEGDVVIVVSGDTTVTVARGAIFTAAGLTFIANDSYVAKVESSLVIAPNDRLLTRRSDGSYSFTITVTAAVPGNSGMLTRNTLIVPDSPPLNYITSFVASDFTNGQDAQTNAELISRLREGIAAKSLGANKINMTAWVRDPEAGDAFNNILQMSVIGHGQPEQLRYHSLFPIAFGGRLDWYVRTVERVQKQALTKTCTLIDNTTPTGIWQFSVDSDDAPGFYDIFQIYRAGNEDNIGTLRVVSEVRGFDLSMEAVPPDIANATEAAYSRYQTTTVQFEDPLVDATELSVGNTADYQVVVRKLPLIQDIQDRVSNPLQSPSLCDVVVRAPVPCFVGLSITVARQADSPVPDVTSMQSALSAVVNQTGFSGRLASSVVYSAIQAYLAPGQTASVIAMTGTLRRPDGTILRLRSRDLLEVPDESVKMVSPRTVQFFLDPEDVGIAIEIVGPSNL